MTEERTITPLDEVDIDLETAADALFLGPQASLIEKIQDFNFRYSRYCTRGDVIQINKNYGFKPGVYDRIKEAHGNYCLGYSSKPKDMWTLKYRIDHNAWNQRTFWRDAIAIQSQMRELKDSNVGWQDNVVVVRQFFDELKERIPNEIESALSIFTNDDITIGIQDGSADGSERWANMRIVVELFTADIDMQVFHQEDEIANYRWGNVATQWKIPFWKFVNNFCEGGLNSMHNGSINNPQAKLYPKYPKMAHPYVGSSYYGDNVTWRNQTCTGDLQSDLKQAAWSLNIEALCTLTRTWLSRYHIPRTNPLNRIQFCYYGWEEGMDAKIWSHRGNSEITVMNDCQWPNAFSELSNYEGENPCDTCQFESGYAYLIDSVDIPEDSEYPGQRVKVIDPCSHAIREYENPTTDEEIIKEACIMHIMCCSVLRNTDDIHEHTDLDYMLSAQNRFPADANLETIYRLNPQFNLSNTLRAEQNQWTVQNSEDLLDMVFDTDIWRNLVDEYIDLNGLGEDDADEAQYDLRHESLDSIRQMIDNERLRREDIHNIDQEGQPILDPLIVTHEDGNLTPEELTIRWAVERGRTINI